MCKTAHTASCSRNRLIPSKNTKQAPIDLVSSYWWQMHRALYCSTQQMQPMSGCRVTTPGPCIPKLFRATSICLGQYEVSDGIGCIRPVLLRCQPGLFRRYQIVVA